jgi:hypothetical protein
MAGIAVKASAGEQMQTFTFGATRATTTTTNQTSNNIPKSGKDTTYEATVTGTGALTATATVNATNDDAKAAGTDTSPWVQLGVITLSGTNSAAGGFATSAAWKWVQVVVTNLTGTGATLKVNQGV